MSPTPTSAYNLAWFRHLYAQGGIEQVFAQGDADLIQWLARQRSNFRCGHMSQSWARTLGAIGPDVLTPTTPPTDQTNTPGDPVPTAPTTRPGSWNIHPSPEGWRYRCPWDSQERTAPVDMVKVLQSLEELERDLPDTWVVGISPTADTRRERLWAQFPGEVLVRGATAKELAAQVTTARTLLNL